MNITYVLCSIFYLQTVSRSVLKTSQSMKRESYRRHGTLSILISYLVVLLKDIAANLISNLLEDCSLYWIVDVIIIIGILGGLWAHSNSVRENQQSEPDAGS